MSPLIAIIAAGGQGLRFSGDRKKQFIVIDDKPLLYYTVKNMSECPCIKHTVIVLPANDIKKYSLILKDLIKNAELHFIEGGETRTESVSRGTSHAMGLKGDLVLVHDAVRPFVKHSMIAELYKKVVEKGECAIPVLSIYDTVVRLKDDEIFSYLDRSAIRLVQTPQIFKKHILKEVLDRTLMNGKTGTDESSLLSEHGYSIGIIKGDPLNIKLTTQDQTEYFKLFFKSYFKNGAYKK